MMDSLICKTLYIPLRLLSGSISTLKKSTLSAINVNRNRAEEVARKWGLTHQFLPTSYVGVLLGGKPNSKAFWEPIFEKIKKKLNNSYISKGGKLTLIKSSLTSFPTYMMSVFKTPKSIYKTVEKHWRNFLWKDKNRVIVLI